MVAPRPNLARRPFVDSRPANLAAALLLVAAIVLTIVSVRTVQAYLAGSRKSREAVASLRAEIARLEAARLDAEKKVARFDLAGMRAGAEEANALARRRTFSWTRFLTRLERALPNDVRVVTVSLSREEKTAAVRTSAPVASDAYRVSLVLVSRDPDGLPKVIRAFYASPFFAAPTPLSEAGGERGSADGRNLSLDVVYLDREGSR